MPSFYDTLRHKPRVVFFSQPNLFAFCLIEKFLTKGVEVYLCSLDPDGWGRLFKRLNRYPRVFVMDNKNVLPEFTDYVVYLDGFAGIDQFSLSATSLLFVNKNTLLVKALDYLSKTKSRVSLVFSEKAFTSMTSKNLHVVNERIKVDSGVKVVVLGDMFGEQVNTENNYVQTLLESLVKNSSLKKYTQNQEIFGIYIWDALEDIVRLSFSHSPFGLFLLGQKFEMHEILQKLNISTEARFGSKISEKALFKSIPYYTPRLITSGSLEKTYKFLSSAIAPAPSLKPSLPFVKINVSKPRKHYSKRVYLSVIFVIFWIAISPFLLWMATGGLLGISYKLLKSGNYTVALKTLSVAAFLSDVAKVEVYNFSLVPIVGAFYRSFYSEADVLFRISSVSQKGTREVIKFTDTATNLFGDKGGNYNNFFKDLSLNLESLGREVSFLEGEIKVFPRISDLLGFINFSKVKKYFEAVSEMSQVVPDLIGINGKKTYLVLFQNNSELRPTGGFIGSFALATLDAGKLIDFSISDVYSADGQLKGHVEPPAPIKQYLREASWYLRDSNWDPDFSISASRAEWFLEKELDRSVDGVVALDLEVVKTLLDVVGTVEVDGFDEKITSLNMYEKLQYAVEKDFFPGSYKKRNLLSALASVIMTKLSDLPKSSYQNLAIKMSALADGRHIQFFFNNQKAQKAISQVGWDGSVVKPNCSGNCQDIFISLIDANLGVNKANYFIKKSYNLEFELKENTVSYSLSENITNASRENYSLGGRYKSYLRAQSGLNAIFLPITIKGGKVDRTIEPEIAISHGIKEAGVLFEVPPSESREVTYEWQEPKLIDTTKAGNLNIYWRKQAGSEADTVSISIKGLGLTGEHVVRYNVSLDRDFSVSIPWK